MSDGSDTSASASAAVRWSDADDRIIGGDLTAALAYVTPARGVVVTAVAPIGLRDQGAGTVGFTTSLGFGKKLQRIERNPRVALAYHAREHGFAGDPRFVLVQGTAVYEREPDPTVLAETVRPASTKFMGAPATGFFWDRYLSAYYADRVLVTVRVHRVVSWPDLVCTGEREVAGAALPQEPPGPQSPPKNGTAPRVDVTRAAKRLRAQPHALVGYLDSDGFPIVTPVRIGPDSERGIGLSGALPRGGRRAGVLGHRYEQKLIGLESRQYTGWLEDGTYAPHSENGFKAPANKTLLLLGNGLMAWIGQRKAKQAAR